MKREPRSGWTIEVYWEEFGTPDEGTMHDRRYHEVRRKPTAREMTCIEKAIERELRDLGLLKTQK